MIYRNVGQDLAESPDIPARAVHLREDGRQSVRLPLGGDSGPLGSGGQALLQPDDSLLHTHRGGSPGEQEASRRGGRSARWREGNGRDGGGGGGILVIVACKGS